MSKIIYVCKECGYVFPSELKHLIEKKTQVYCENCGAPFSLEGVSFKKAEFPYRKDKIKAHIVKSDNSVSNLNKIIQFFNAISFIPILIFSIVVLSSLIYYVVEYIIFAIFSHRFCQSNHS